MQSKFIKTTFTTSIQQVSFNAIADSYNHVVDSKWIDHFIYEQSADYKEPVSNEYQASKITCFWMHTKTFYVHILT